METDNAPTPAETMPPWKAVCEDVLKQLNSLKLSTDVYLSVLGAPRTLRNKIVENLDSDLQPLVDEIQPHCRMCFVGACVLSKARVLDALPVSSVFDDDFTQKISTVEAEKILAGVFDPDDLNRMEAAFMADPWYVTYYAVKRRGVTTSKLLDHVHEDAYGAALFGWEAGGRSYTNLQDRVRAVMTNVIENDGRFVFPPRTREEWEESGAGNYL